MPNTVIQLKKSATPSAAPSDLANGELAINFADGKLFYKNTAGFIAEISGAGSVVNSFGTVNANGTLVIADTPGDVLNLVGGTGISIVGDVINDVITITATGNAVASFDAANTSNVIAVAAFAKANAALANATGTFAGNLTIAGNLVANSTITGLLQHSPVAISRLLTSFDAADSDGFGRVALSGDASVLAVGAATWEGATGTDRGGVYIYDWNGSAWVQRGSVIGAADAADNDFFGYALALNNDGSVLAVGAGTWEGATGSNRGGVYIYDWNGSSWVQRGSVIEAADAADNDFFGQSVSLSSNASILVVGAGAWEGRYNSIGGVYTYDWNGSAWVQRGSVLEPTDAANTTYSFGQSVSLSSNGNVLIVGAPNRDSGAVINKGAVFVYNRNGSSWTQRTMLEASDGTTNDYFGFSVATNFDGSVIAVGAREWEGATGSNRGGVYIYDWNGSAWVQRGFILEASDAADTDRFGTTLDFSYDGSILVVSATSWEGATGTDRGAVYTYTLTGALPAYSGIGTGSGWIEGSSSSLVARTSGLDRITIDASGNVGIGTTVASYKLDVAGSVRAGSQGNTSFIIPSQYGSSTIGSNKPVYYPGSSNILSFIGGPGGGEYVFDSADSNWKFIIRSGNVGIGTEFPNSKLQIVGTANITSNLVVQGADVFQTLAGANTAVGTGANTVGSAAFAKANSAETIAIAAYANSNTKYSSSGGTITGDVSIVGNLSVSGNTSYISVQNYRVDDPLIYLAGNNYVSDIVDIGFIGNYNNGSSNLHTGLFRDHQTKEYYLFHGYNQEPENNHIDPNGNNFTISVLNAAIRTSNISLAGANLLLTLAGSNTAVGTGANAFTSATIAGANTAVGSGANAYATAVGTGANNYLLATIAGANTAIGTGANTYLLATLAGANSAVGAGANTVGTAAFVKANNALANSTGTFAGDLTVSGLLNVSSNLTVMTSPVRVWSTGGFFTITTSGNLADLSSQSNHDIQINNLYAARGVNGPIQWGRNALGTSNTPYYYFENNFTIAQRNGVNGQSYRLYGTYTDGSNYERIAITANSAGHYIIGEEAGTGAARPLYLGANNAIAATIDASGNVGIGTTSPAGSGQRVLEVAGVGGGVNDYGSLALRNASDSGNGLVGSVDFKGSTTTYAAVKGIIAAGGASGSGQLRFYTLTGGSLTSKATLDQNGRFSASSLLSSGGLVYGTEWDGLIIQTNNTGAGANGRIVFQDYASNPTSAIKGLYPGGTSNGSLSFMTNAGAGLVEHMRINTIGNIGIGTTAPAYKLEVAGSFAAQTKSFIINHQSKPNHRLRYGSLEGPENGVYVRGKSSSNVIDLPDYWTWLVDEDTITVNITPIGSHQKLFVEKIENNKVYISNDAWLTTDVKYFYTVYGERKDVDKLIVEIPNP